MLGLCLTLKENVVPGTASLKRRAAEYHFGYRVPDWVTVIAAMAPLLISHAAFGQTTRTSPSAASTSQTIPLSSSTTPSSPCYSSNPTSPCYSTRAPRIRCYSALTPDQPCFTVTTPDSRPSPQPSPTPIETRPANLRALTEDQARAQIEANGYSKISRLQKDAEGVWHAQAEKDGLLQPVTLDAKGNVTTN
jgi:hypothetical protein